MLSFFKRFVNYNEREITRLQKIVDQINLLDDKAKALKDADFPAETKSLQESIRSGEKKLDEVLPWSFALVREAGRRVNNMRHYDVQLMAGVALHEGKVVEQKTGEGKTLTATTALYLNALAGKGAHLVTVNDYLARRDAGWMGSIFHFLGMTTSAMISGASLLYDPEFTDADAHDPRLIHLRTVTRKEAYAADITYGINSEFGFDYLRDNMAQQLSGVVQRGFTFAIVDEADSVLIDEARTPHIISAPYEQDTSKYFEYAKIVKQLSPETDYIIDEKLRTAHLTEPGIEKIEKMLGIENIYEKDFEMVFHIEAALKAEVLFKKDKEYIVRGSEVVIVDEFTGRLLEGRRFSEGLHQAIEAKENVAIQRESRTLATVSLQNYFRMYEKLAGMTGTAATEAEEFSKIYKTEVLVMPTHRDMVRIDHPDMIYKTEAAKFNAVVEDIAEQYKKGRPVLVGTTAIDKNEHLSHLLKKRGIPHELLNAKNHEREASIIAQAGKKNAITVATNMAGRGVDIILGGDLKTENIKTDAQRKKAQAEWQKEHEIVTELGGLYVIGTERHESRRIDNQLRGRAGRQCDAGETRFYVSLEDDVMRIFGGEQISSMMTMLKFPEDQPLSHSMVSRAIEQAQIKVEGFHFDSRKHVVEYDDVLNKQREILYKMRHSILFGVEQDIDAFNTTVQQTIDEQIASMGASFFALQESDPEMQDQFSVDVATLFNLDPKKLKSLIEGRDQESFTKYIEENVAKQLEEKKKTVGPEIWNQVIRSMFLSSIDQYWTQHLTAIEDLREGINLRGYAQMDPLVEYKNEAFKLFEKLLDSIRYEAIRRMMYVEITMNPHGDEHEGHNHAHYNYNETPKKSLAEQVQPKAVKPVKAEKKASSPSVSEPSAEAKKKLGRNDLCPCGSGKKWKKCHFPNMP
ncbi:MAG: preprotein translocase subunit SecA [Weeksellaceae bacterium]